MLKLKYIMFFAVLILASCTKKKLDDPKLGLKLNSEKEQVVKRIGELLDSNKMEPPRFFTPGTFKDTAKWGGLKYDLAIRNDTLSASLDFKMSDQFLGKLDEVVIELRETDTTSTKLEPSRDNAWALNSVEMAALTDYLKSYYGEPDSQYVEQKRIQLAISDIYPEMNIIQWKKDEFVLNFLYLDNKRNEENLYFKYPKLVYTAYKR